MPASKHPTSERNQELHSSTLSYTYSLLLFLTVLWRCKELSDLLCTAYFFVFLDYCYSSLSTRLVLAVFMMHLDLRFATVFSADNIQEGESLIILVIFCQFDSIKGVINYCIFSSNSFFITVWWKWHPITNPFFLACIYRSSVASGCLAFTSNQIVEVIAKHWAGI